MTYPGGSAGQAGEVVATGYTGAGLLNSVSGNSTYLQSATYDAAGRVDLLTLGANVLNLDYVYNPWTSQGGRLQQLKAGPAGTPTILQNLTYSYDAVGNVLSIADANAGGTQTQSFGYDSLDRLTSAAATGGISGTYGLETYTFAANGNLLVRPDVGAYSYNTNLTGCAAGTAANKPHAVTNVGGLAYTYDCNGNMLARNMGTNGNFSLAYDGENHLTSLTGSATASFVYDGDGQRVKATLNGVTTVYIGNYL